MLRRVSLFHNLLKCMRTVEAAHPRQVQATCLFTSQSRFCHQQTGNIPSVKVLDPVSSSKDDTFFQDIKELNSIEEIMAVIENGTTLINSQHLSQVFVKLYYMARDQPSTVSGLLSDRLFPVLCQYALKHIRQFNKDEVFYLARALCFLNFPLESTLGQACLQMLRHFINDLSLYQITFLEQILTEKPSNVLVDALKKALPLTFEIKVNFELVPHNHWQVVDCLDMAIRYRMDINTIAKLTSIVYHKAEAFSKPKLLKVVTSLSKLKPFPPNFKSAGVEVLKSLQRFVEELSAEETTSLLLALRNARHLHYPKLLNALSHKCCVESWDLFTTSLLLSIFNSHKFTSTSVLNWTIDSIKENPAPLWEDERVSLLTIFESLSEANQSIDGTEFISIIRQCDEKLQKLAETGPELLVKLAVHLAVLECLPSELLEQVFQPEFISNARQSAAAKSLEPPLLQCYLILEQYARLEGQSNHQQVFLPPELVKEAIRVRAQVMKPVDLVLQEFLEVGLGGPQFMLTGLWTRLGHFIDHLVVMRKEDFPVELNSEKSLVVERDSEGFAYVEDVVVPQNTKILAVLVARKEWFNEDPPSLRGWMAFQQKCLAKLGYNPVIIGPPLHNAEHVQDIDCCLASER